MKKESWHFNRNFGVNEETKVFAFSHLKENYLEVVSYSMMLSIKIKYEMVVTKLLLG